LKSLELTQKVAQFLLQPEDLTWFFLPVLMAVFALGAGYAVWHGRQLRGRLDAIEKEYAAGPAHGRVAPGAYIQMCLEEDADRQMVDSVPSMLVTIGILGTFLGLGIALQVAGGGLTSSESALASLDILLQTVAFKFQTSAWGILLSVVFQVVVVNPHHRWAERTHERAERAMLSAYLPAGEAMRVALEPVVASLGDATREVAKTSGRMVTAMTEFQSKMDASTQRLEKAMGALDGVGKRLDEAIDRMGSSVASTLKEEVARQGEQSRVQQGALLAELERVSTAVGDLQATTADVGPTLHSAVSSMQTAVTEGLAAELRGVASTLKEEVAKQGEQARVLQGALRIELERVATAVGELHAETAKVGPTLQSAVSSMQTAVTEGLSADLRGVSRAISSLDGVMATIESRMSSSLHSVVEAIGKMEQAQDTAFRQLDNGLTGRLREVATVLTDLDASLKAQLDKLNSELGTHLGATREHTLELSVTMTEVREALQGLERHVGRMVDVLEVAESGRAANELSDLLDLGAFGAQIADDG
jgi:hypothetical protein